MISNVTILLSYNIHTQYTASLHVYIHTNHKGKVNFVHDTEVKITLHKSVCIFRLT